MPLTLALLLSCNPFPCASDELLDSKGECHPASDTGEDTVYTSDTAEPGGCSSSCDCSEGELCYEGACAVAGPALEIYRARVEAVRDAMDPTSGGFTSESAYPTEAMLTLASASDLLCDPTLAEAARARADFARSWENADHLLVWSGYPYITRDYNARHIYNLWAAGQILGDDELRAAADATAEAMLDLERVSHGDGELFCVSYETTAPYACVGDYTWIDVNQNSELGLAFALLYTDPDSALYGDPRALAVLEDELAAAISVQDEETGAIPIAESGGYEDDYDTLYGSYAAWSWALADAAMPELGLSSAVDGAAAWLLPMSGVEPLSHRTYPYPYDGDISLSEGAMRMPVLARAGVLDPAFVEVWWEEIVAPNTETYSTWLPLWLELRAGVGLEELFPRG